MAPTITRISPTSGPELGGTIITIVGSGFASAGRGAAVTFGTTPAITANVDSDTQITALAPAGTGQVTVLVRTADAAATSGAVYTFLKASSEQPAVTGISPSAGPIEGGIEVEITGFGLLGTTTVSFGSVPASILNIVDDTRVIVTAPALADGYQAGSVHVSVTSPGGTSAATPDDEFSYIGTPAITALDPASGGIDGGAMVVITGTALSQVTDVWFGDWLGVVASVDGDTQLTVITPEGQPGTVDVVVVSAGGYSEPTAASQFIFTGAELPIVSGVEPASVPLDGGRVAIDGTGLTDILEVWFGGVPGTDIEPISDTQFVASAPAVLELGPADIMVRTAKGFSAITPNVFAYSDIVDPWAGVDYCPAGFRSTSDIVDPWATDDPPEAWGGASNIYPFGEFVVAEILDASDLGARASAPADLMSRIGPVFTAAINKPAKALTTAEADTILVALHFAGMIELKSAINDNGSTFTISKVSGLVNLGSWMRITKLAAMPTGAAALADGVIWHIYRGLDSLSVNNGWTVASILGAKRDVTSVDPRFAVALYRIAAFASQWWNSRALYNVGIFQTPGDHSDGKAIDLSGMLWEDDKTTLHDFIVGRDWGAKPIPGLPAGTTLWPSSSDHHTRYRLAQAYRDGDCTARFFAQMYRCLHTQLTNTGPDHLPDDPDAELADGSQQLKFPDYSAANPGLQTGSHAHWNHYHAKLV